MTTSETLDVIARRYACRAFQDTPVPEDIVRAVAEAGVRAPSAINRQPWRLTVITDRAKMAEIEQAGVERLRANDPAGFARAQKRGLRLLYNASAMIIVSTEAMVSPYPVEMDAGIVASHLVLAATSLGLDTCVAAMPGAGLDDPILKARYLPEGFDFAISVLLGYAATPGGTPHVPDFSKIVYV
ncbi:MAG: nitroreductase family protein [Propionibacteriaceae bacterium]|nr:nitroreductase family protein [Propionibacteriaceae bacterium]